MNKQRLESKENLVAILNKTTDYIEGGTVIDD